MDSGNDEGIIFLDYVTSYWTFCKCSCYHWIGNSYNKLSFCNCSVVWFERIGNIYNKSVV